MTSPAMTYPLHPLCTLFPRLDGAEFNALREDIKANGQRAPITLYEGMVLDGGNRYRACIEAGIEPTFVEFDGGDVVAFVRSANFHRRHLSPGQMAVIVASLQDWAKAQTVGKPKSVNVDQLATVEQRAAQSGASRSTQKMADKVAKASPDLAKKVAHGEVSLPAAVKQIEPKKPAEPKDDAHDDIDPIAEWERTQREVEQLQAVIDALDAADPKAELAKQIRIRQGIESRLSDAMEQIKQMEKTNAGYGKWYAELRKLTGLEERHEITRFVREAVQAKESAL